MIRALGAQRHADSACAEGATSQRTCIVTREATAPEHLIRFALAPDGTVVPDVAQKLPGRGVWVTGRRDVVDRAAKGGFFSRGFKQKATADAALAAQVDTLLFRRALEFLSLCNKAGLVLTGAGKVNSWLEAGGDGILVQATDASADGLEKIARKFRAVRTAAGEPPVEVSLLTIDDLSLAIGRANVVHAALNHGRASANFLVASRRVQQYRTTQEEFAASISDRKAQDDQLHPIRNTG